MSSWEGANQGWPGARTHFLWERSVHSIIWSVKWIITSQGGEAEERRALYRECEPTVCRGPQREWTYCVQRSAGRVSLPCAEVHRESDKTKTPLLPIKARKADIVHIAGSSRISTTEQMMKHYYGPLFLTGRCWFSPDRHSPHFCLPWKPESSLESHGQTSSSLLLICSATSGFYLTELASSSGSHDRASPLKPLLRRNSIQQHVVPGSAKWWPLLFSISHIYFIKWIVLLTCSLLSNLRMLI